ncbi:MAG: hypothetical protein P8Y07_12285, partial [Gemmatimonadales bacterium]
TKNGWIWGVGPVISIPIGKDEFTSDQWGLGPTFVALKQQGPWTYGALLNHVWGINAPSEQPVSKLTHIGKQPVSFQVGYRHYFDTPPGGPDWGLRFAVTFLFPK